MFSSAVDSTQPKAQFYAELADTLRALVADEPDPIANLANAAALLSHSLPAVNWVGFYLLRSGELVLGPFQGRPACVRIPLGRGVCGTSAERGETIVVADVEKFPGHIVCDTASRAEIVVPLVSEGNLVGVLDVDAPTAGRFDDQDRQGLERCAAVLAAQILWSGIASIARPTATPDSASPGENR
jgi:L-methionine (R)-S-oxide reductase